MDERKYIINIGTFTVNETTYPDRCLSASYGGTGVEVDSIPWGENENPWDYKYENGEFIFDPITIVESVESQISSLKAQLASTDYKAIKYAEGWLTADDYAPIKAEREALREQIRQLTE